MIVTDFKLKLAYTPRHNFSTYELIVNGQIFTSNFAYYELEDNFLQIELCDECMGLGCSNNNYVELIEAKDYIIWKTPLLDNIPKNSFLSFLNPSRCLNSGTIFWPIKLYENLLIQFKYNLHLHKLALKNKLNKYQAQHLWLIYASKCLHFSSTEVFSYEYLEENFLVFYSDIFDTNECYEVYSNIKSIFENSSKFEIEVIPSTTNKVAVIFDTYKNYAEWDFLYILDNMYYLPISRCVPTSHNSPQFAIKVTNDQ